MAQEMSVSGVKASARGVAIGFELATTSPWKRVKQTLYNGDTQLAFNIAATALMIFQPELTPIILPIVIANNEIANLDELVRRYENNTLSAGTVGLTLAQIGLDILPFVG